MASIAIVLMALLRKTLRRPLGSGVLLFGWLLVAIRLLAPISLSNPFIYTIRPPHAMDAAIRPIAGQLKVRLGDLLSDLAFAGPKGVQLPASGLRAALESASLSITLSRLYLVGVAAVAVWMIAVNIQLRQRLRSSRIGPISGPLLQDYQALCQSLRVKPLPVYLADPLPGACLIGVLRPYIALPAAAAPPQALLMLRHELIHCKSHDPLWGVVRLLCCALHWFNPLVWMAAGMSYTDAEMRCDERTTAAFSPRQKEEYANMLVLSAARRSGAGASLLATNMSQTHRKLKARVLAIIEGKKPLRWLAASFVLLASMALAGAFATREGLLTPRMPGFSQALEAQQIATPQQAIAYAQAIVQRSELNWPQPKDVSWKAQKKSPKPAGFYRARHLRRTQRSSVFG